MRAHIPFLEITSKQRTQPAGTRAPNVLHQQKDPMSWT